MTHQNLNTSIDAVLSRAADGETWWCASLTSTSDAWCQVTWDHINFAYPRDEEPTGLLGRLPVPEGSQLASYEAGKFATLKTGTDDVDGLAQFVMQLMQALWPDASFEVALEQL